MASFNVYRAISTAKRGRYLTGTGTRGELQITADGEAVVDALPDKEKVDKVSSQRTRRRRGGARRKSTRKAQGAAKAKR